MAMCRAQYEPKLNLPNWY